MNIAEIVVDVPLASGEDVFDYLIPEELLGQVVPGSRVLVPFGKRQLEGYVLRVKDFSAVKGLRAIIKNLDELPPLNEELLEVGKYISERYICPLFLTLQAMVPASIRSRYVKWIEWNQERDHLPLIVLPEEDELLQYIRKRKSCQYSLLLKKFPQAEEMIDRFVDKGFLKVLTRNQDSGKIQTEELVESLLDRSELETILNALPKSAKKQRAILEYLMHEPHLPLKDLLSATNATRQSIKALSDRGYVSITEREVRRNPYLKSNISKQKPFPLTEEQQSVYQTITNAFEENRQQTFLLHGVTGSGKTEVYLQIIDAVLKKGKEAIVLVPEISLTPMMVERFKSRFGERVAVLHSGLSTGEKYDEWRRIRDGEANVVVGARSAIFAPVKRLGVIIIDEEHESSYKQEETPRYHARDVAIKRANLHQAVVILGSATPSLETYAYAKAGRFQLLELKKRVNERPLPNVILVDMREEIRAGHRHMFSRLLLEKIEDRLKRKEQMVLLLNRRGYSTFVICRSCGYTAECPHCDISLTYHHTNQTIRCHYCGYTEQAPKQCPKCKSEHIRFFGTGTQKVEAELMKLFPGIRVIRMDLDTTSRKGAHERLLKAFGNHEGDVLLGTQMIAKGLDFPKVSLVGMISADTTLHLPDFRAAERTFQLITQVAGRAGRHDIPGEVVVQTYSPEHYSIHLAVDHDYGALFQQEIRLRKANRYPPFYRLCLIQFTHPEIPALIKALEKLTYELRILLSTDSQILGPVPAQIPKIKDRYRYQCMIKYKDEPNLNDKIQKALSRIQDLIRKHELQVIVDIDPRG